MRKYRKNPDHPNTCLNGIVFDEDTVVAGEQWEQWTRAQFPGKPPVLILAPTDTKVTKQTAPPAREPAKAPESGVKFTTNTDGADKPGDQPASKGSLSEIQVKPAEMPPHEPPTVEPKPEPESEPEPEVDPAIYEGMEDDGDEEAEESDLGLEDIPGVGPGRARALKSAGYLTVKQVAEAEAPQMVKDVGARKMTVATARSIISKAKRLLEG